MKILLFGGGGGCYTAHRADGKQADAPARPRAGTMITTHISALMLKHVSLLLALSALPLMAQSAKEVADQLTQPALDVGAKKIPLPEVPKGVDIKFGGADYEQIITKDGSVRPVISEVPVHVFYKVTKDGQTVDSKDYEVVVKPADPAGADANAKPATIPTILQWKGAQGEWKPGNEIRVAGRDDCHVKNFVRDLKRLLPQAKVLSVSPKQEHDIYLTLLTDDRQKTNSPEGYRLDITPEKVTISGDTPLGTFWGTRTLLQILTTQGALPCGQAIDFPRYKVRGCMLDIARLPYALQDLRDMVDMMAWYKMNDLHLVINNNYIFHEHYVDANRDPMKESYAAFRLESKVRGKNGVTLTAKDHFYTKKDFRDFIDYAKERSVNIVPEFDTPGHALAFTRVRPDLIYQGNMHRPKRRCEMLDAANPETLRFVASVFDEYLMKDSKLHRPVFEGCVVHVGSDEFFGAAEDYRKYTDGVLNHVLLRGYTPRVWGSLSAKKGKTPVVSKGVQMNIWSKDWMLPFDAIEQGYDIINTYDRDLYLVPFANYYRMDRNHKGLYNNWLPNKVWNQQVPAGHPQLLGAAFAVWNDECDIRYRGYGMADIWDALAGSMDVLCGRLWGEQKRDIPFEQHRQLAKKLGYGPALASPAAARVDIKTAGPLPRELNLPALRPPYHLTLEGVKLTKATPGKEQVLLSGPEGEFFAALKNGSIGFRRADSVEFAWDAKLPVGKAVTLEIIGEMGKTRLLIDGQEVQGMSLTHFNNAAEDFGKRTKDIISTFILPMNQLGKSFRGSIQNIKKD